MRQIHEDGAENVLLLSVYRVPCRSENSVVRTVWQRVCKVRVHWVKRTVWKPVMSAKENASKIDPSVGCWLEREQWYLKTSH